MTSDRTSTPRARFQMSLCLALAWLCGAGMLHTQARDRNVVEPANAIDLSGTWQMRLDPNDRGKDQSWAGKDFPELIRLPGSLQSQGHGDLPSMRSPWTGEMRALIDSKHAKIKRHLEGENFKIPSWLQPERIYVGAAWYAKEVEIPEAWAGKRVTLHLERPHWETTLWIDERLMGSQNGLGTAHEYDLSGSLSPGKHHLTIRVDNRMIVNVGENAHSVSDHTQSNWNGIVGAIELRAGEPIWLDEVQVFPSARKKSARVEVKLGNQTGIPGEGKLIWEVLVEGRRIRQGSTDVRWAESGGELQFEVSLGPEARLWDEFEPNLHKLRLRLEPGGDEREVVFGLRDLGKDGTQFTINGRKLFLRGTLECAIFPRTGYPPTDVDSWKRIYRICREYGLNHVRFHSWCPPRAAFVAADEMGVYLQVEASSWTRVGDGEPIDSWLYEEAHRMVRDYGNHPSFAFMAYGNEPQGAKRDQWLGQWCDYWRKRNPRALHAASGGWVMIDESDYHVVYRGKRKNCRIQVWGAGLDSIINAEAPKTTYDWRDYLAISGNKPTISHEIGQWCVYPDFDEIKKYTGVLKARNFEIFQELLEENHMGDQARDFLMASGKLQVLCYKADIEASLRTKGFGGFQLLDLHDFPGQGTALVGVLDAFWDPKPYVTAQEYRRFCGPSVPLARLGKRTFSTADSFEAALEIAHFGPHALTAATPCWKVVDSSGAVVKSGKLGSRDIPIDNGIHLGDLRFDCSTLKVPAKYRLVVGIEGQAIENDWDFWVYPKTVEESADDILITDGLTEEALKTLQQGGKVLWLAHRKRTKEDVQIGFSSVFWNTVWTKQQPPHTLGILCNPKHPVFDAFPTEYHSNWQWWELVHGAHAMVLDALPPKLRPLVQPIDTWNEARRLGLLFECRVNDGKLMVCSMDISSDLDQRHVARQFRKSLLDYLSGSGFDPQLQLNHQHLLGISDGGKQK